MQRLPSLAALRAFECVARHKSFTKAADELCVTPPSLSHHIKALEDELGYKLFIRMHRSIDLTERGTELFASANRAFGSLSKTWQELRQTPKSFKISCGVHFMTNWFVHRSARFQEALSEFEIDLITTFNKLNFEAGEVDLAVRNGNEAIAGYHSETIYKEWWTPMVSPEVATKLKQPSDLLNLQLIESRLPREPKGHPSAFEWLTAAGVEREHTDVRLIPNTETAMQMAADGLGFKLCASIQVNDLHRRGKLVAPYQLAIRREDIRFYILCRSGEERDEPITMIRDFFQREFAAMDKALAIDEMQLVTLPASVDVSE